jgi:anti-sigma factor RsiW
MDHQTATTTQAVERYLLGELAGQDRDDFEEHYFSCAECAEAVRNGAILTANGKALAREQALRPSGPGQVTEIRPRPGRARSSWISIASSAAAAVLLSISGYQNLVTIPALKAPRAVERSVLRAQARGGVPAVHMGGQNSQVLALELNVERPLPAYRVELVEAGKVVFAIPQVPVQDGVLEVAPPRDLAPGHYEILVRNSPDGSEAARYPFQIER